MYIGQLGPFKGNTLSLPANDLGVGTWDLTLQIEATDVKLHRTIIVISDPPIAVISGGNVRMISQEYGLILDGSELVSAFKYVWTCPKSMPKCPSTLSTSSIEWPIGDLFLGIYTIELKVQDQLGQWSLSAFLELTVADGLIPTASLVLSGERPYVNQGERFSFIGTCELPNAIRSFTGLVLWTLPPQLPQSQATSTGVGKPNLAVGEHHDQPPNATLLQTIADLQLLGRVCGEELPPLSSDNLLMITTRAFPSELAGQQRDFSADNSSATLTATIPDSIFDSASGQPMYW